MPSPGVTRRRNLAAPAASGIAIVGGAQGTQQHGTGTGVQGTFKQATTAGNLGIGWVQTADSATSNPFSVNQGWSVAITQTGSSAYQWSGIIYKADLGSGETAPTVTTTDGGSYLAVQLAEFSGAATTSPLHKTGQTSGGGQTISAQCTAADTIAKCLIVAAAFWNGGNAPTEMVVTMTDSDSASVTPAGTYYNNSGGITNANYWGVAGAVTGSAGDEATMNDGVYNGSSACIVSFHP